MIGIYKYENKIDGKIYIGRSIHIERRKWEHVNHPSPYSYFDTTIGEIGESAFNFEVIEECSADLLKEREKYWIKYYNCCVLDNPNGGYNLTRGGEEYRSDENPWAKLTLMEVKEIIDKLANSTISIQQLAKDYHMHWNTISDINRCRTWNWLHDYKNNIRKEAQGSVQHGELGSNKISEQEAQHIIDLLKYDKRSIAQLARDEHLSLNILYDINGCRTWTYLHKYQKNVRNEYRKEDINWKKN